MLRQKRCNYSPPALLSAIAALFVRVLVFLCVYAVYVCVCMCTPCLPPLALREDNRREQSLASLSAAEPSRGKREAERKSASLHQKQPMMLHDR